ncbi:MAG: ribose 5-phosphate isomerase B [Clostridiales bacterium]|jgi:ribose 5-phosphate isomerase B|nr:ribose 5-phosphate isomerase B [Clostridiales bacterium]
MRRDTEIWIGSDHGGYELKQHILKWLKEQGYVYRDFGSDSTEIVRYPYFALEVAGGVSAGMCERGILICSTGIGMSIVANRFKGVRASLCASTYMARMTRAHNDSNILCLGGMLIGKLEALDILETWLNTDYIGDRHEISLNLIREIDSALDTRDVKALSGVGGKNASGVIHPVIREVAE